MDTSGKNVYGFNSTNLFFGILSEAHPAKPIRQPLAGVQPLVTWSNSTSARCSVLLEGWWQLENSWVKMALSKPLASWRTWWTGTDTVPKIAEVIYQTMDPTRLPGNGTLIQLKMSGKVTPADLDDIHTSKIVEALLEAYPAEKEPSGYCLGDAVMCLNSLMGDSLIGPMKANPMDEKVRRDSALKQGTILKLLLSYVRNSSARTHKGRTESVTFLKELALSKGRPDRKSKGKSNSPSSASTCSTTSAVTLLLDGRPITDLDRTPMSSGGKLAKTTDASLFFDVLPYHPNTRNIANPSIFRHVKTLFA